MTFHRFLYKLCWRSRFILPLIIVAVIVVSLVLSGSSVEYSADGKVRIKYKHQHGLVPRMENLLPKPLAHPDPGDHAHAHHHKPGEVPAVHLVARKPDQETMHFHGGKDGRQGDEDNLDSQVLLYNDVHHVRVDAPQRSKLNHDLLAASKTRHKHVEKMNRLLVPGWKTSVYYDPTNPPEIFVKWTEMREPSCDGKFVGFANEFTFINQLLINGAELHSSRKGGENIEDVLNQPEEYEFYRFGMGSYQIPCNHRPLYYFNNKNHLNDWMENLKTKNLDTGKPDQLISDFTIAITRYEYVNIYHTMTDWYNAFLLMEYFDKTQRETNILFIDSHPLGALDPVWPVLFNSTMRVGHLPPKTVFTNIAWGMLGYNSPLLEFFNPSLPLVEEFREFFLSSYRINTARKLDCDKLSILFIWRRDYLAHPRNPSGTVSRKFENERDLLTAVQRQYRDHRVKGVQIDLFDMQQQLQFISDADILVGMHGAGLTHAVFLQKHAGVIEFVPNYFSSSNEHFSAISSWRKLHYEKWVNTDMSNELPNDQTKIPPHTMVAIIKGMVKRVCEPHRMVNGTEVHPSEAYFEPKFIESPMTEQEDIQADLDTNKEDPNEADTDKETSKPRSTTTFPLSDNGAVGNANRSSTS